MKQVVGVDGYKLELDHLIPPKGGIALEVNLGDVLRIIDEQGQQVSDLVAFSTSNPKEHISATQTNKLNAHLNLKKGDALYSTDCNKMFQLTKVTNPKVHYNFIFSPCGDADNSIRFPNISKGETCLGILKRVFSEYSFDWRDMLEPFSIGLNLAIRDDWALETKTPLSKPGDFVELKAMMDCIVGITACPQDRNMCNGGKLKPIRVQRFTKNH